MILVTALRTLDCERAFGNFHLPYRFDIAPKAATLAPKFRFDSLKLVL